MRLLSSVPLTYLFLHLLSVSAVFLPAEVFDNGTSFTIPFNQSSLVSSSTPGPPGFTADYVWNVSNPLSPLAIYVTAIRLMYGLTLQSWSSPVELLESGLGIVTQTPNYNVIIFTNDEPPGTELTTSLVVKVLLEAVTDMARRDPGFYQVAIFMAISEIRIGRMMIYNRRDPDTQPLDDEGVFIGTSTARSHNSTGSIYGIDRSSPNITLLTDFNSIIDPSDRRFKITWQWDGENIPNQDIFSAALNGLAIVAQFDRDDPCPSITALSTSRNAILHIGRSTTEETLFAGQISRTFFLLINKLFLVQRRFEEMWIDLSYDGESIADGYIYKVRRLGGGNATQGVANE